MRCGGAHTEFRQRYRNRHSSLAHEGLDSCELYSADVGKDLRPCIHACKLVVLKPLRAIMGHSGHLKGLTAKCQRVFYEFAYVSLLLTLSSMLCIAKPRYIKLIVKGYYRAVRQKRTSRA